MRVELTKEKVIIPVEGKGETSGILTFPATGPNRTAIIVAHGAGNDMYNPLLAFYAEALAAEGYSVLRFNFLYSDRGRKSPDKKEALFAAWQAAYGFLLSRMGPDLSSVTGAGKSMGGRIAAEMSSLGLLPVDRLIFLGYPLHPAGEKEKLRDSPLYLIHVPMLFFAGTRDPLCDLALLSPVLSKLKAPWELLTIQGGDHSFHVTKSSPLSDGEVYRALVAKSVEWLSRPTA